MKLKSIYTNEEKYSVFCSFFLVVKTTNMAAAYQVCRKLRKTAGAAIQKGHLFLSIRFSAVGRPFLDRLFFFCIGTYLLELL